MYQQVSYSVNMRYLLTAFLIFLSPSTEARRWRFAIPFPGSIEQQSPESNHKPFDGKADLEKVFDTKQTASMRNKVVFEETDAMADKKKNRR
jgi:hypothetical protein